MAVDRGRRKPQTLLLVFYLLLQMKLRETGKVSVTPQPTAEPQLNCKLIVTYSHKLRNYLGT